MDAENWMPGGYTLSGTKEAVVNLNRTDIPIIELFD